MMFLALFSSFVRWLWLCRVRALKCVLVPSPYAFRLSPSAVAVAVASQLSPFSLPDLRRALCRSY